MIPPPIRIEILRRLKQLETEHSIRILFAVDAGTRAWGCATKDSAFDVRFVYAQDPRWYLSVDLEERRDVIEDPNAGSIQLNGWDVRKALRLYRKSNPAFVEWLQSPISYLERGNFRRAAQESLATVYTPVRGVYHYRSQARTDYREHILAPMVPLKEYFGVLRSLLTVRWLERHGSAAPVDFGRLLPLIIDQPEVVTRVRKLLEQAPSMIEPDMILPVPALNAFIEAELASVPMVADSKPATEAVLRTLNRMFHGVMAEMGRTP